jgi:flagellar biosynthesis protein FliQ
MTATFLHQLRHALFLVLILAAPPVLAVLAVGVATAILQTATQVRERTISSVPKLIAAGVALAIAGPWIGSQLVAFFRAMIELVPQAGR